MAIATYDDIVSRTFSNWHANWLYYGEVVATTAAFGGNSFALVAIGDVKALPSLPSGVSAYIPTCFQGAIGTVTTPRTMLLCEVFDLGSLNIAGPTFTDGGTFPTRTELGSSRDTFGPVFVEITTGLNSNPGNYTITYVDQDGNSAETTTSQALPVSGAARSVGFVPLNTGDVGVKDITAANRTGGTSPTGVLKFWGVIPVAYCANGQGGTIFTYPFHTQTFNWVKLDAGAQLRCFAFGGVTTHGPHTIAGCIDIVGDS